MVVALPRLAFCCDSLFLPQRLFSSAASVLLRQVFSATVFSAAVVFSATTGVFCDNASQRTAKLRICRKKQTISVLFFVFLRCNAFAKHVGAFSKNVGYFPENDGLFPKNVGDFSRSVRAKISRARGFSRENATRKSNSKKLKIRKKGRKPQFLYKKESQFLFRSPQVARFLGGLGFLEILGFLVFLEILMFLVFLEILVQLS